MSFKNYHDYNTNKKIGKNKMTQENESNGEPLTVWSDFQVFLDLSPSFYLYYMRKNKNVSNKMLRVSNVLVSMSYCDKCKKRQHGCAKRSPVLFISSNFLIAKHIVSNHSEERHQHGQQDNNVKDRITNGIDEGDDKDLKTLDERDGTKGSSSYWKEKKCSKNYSRHS